MWPNVELLMGLPLPPLGWERKTSFVMCWDSTFMCVLSGKMANALWSKPRLVSKMFHSTTSAYIARDGMECWQWRERSRRTVLHPEWPAVFCTSVIYSNADKLFSCMWRGVRLTKRWQSRISRYSRNSSRPNSGLLMPHRILLPSIVTSNTNLCLCISCTACEEALNERTYLSPKDSRKNDTVGLSENSQCTYKKGTFFATSSTTHCIRLQNERCEKASIARHSNGLSLHRRSY